MVYYNATDRLLIIPPFLSCGIIVCFLCADWIIVSIGCLLVFVTIVIYCFKPHFSIFLWICFGFLLGMGCGAFYDLLYYEKNPITEIHKNLQITGSIIDIQDNADKPRIILKVHDYKTHKISQNIRLNISHLDYERLNYHDIITANVYLAPPAEALFKGAYNFKFYAQLQGFGATGRILNIIKHIPVQKKSFIGFVHEIRLNIAHLILEKLPIATASPIIAMVTGVRFYIPNHITEIWKASGIYHLLSISGLHITIIAGICFVIMRRLLLCIPALAHGIHVKKIAALCTIPLTFGYVLLSGGDVPVIRAYIMVCVGLVAILCNQHIITLRSVCVAFCIVLIINPIDIFNIGFALSFAAVFGIIIAVNMINFFKKSYSISKIMNFMIVNIFAGYAGFPLAIYVFNSSAIFGLFTNMLAVPMSGIIIMPVLVLSVILMPFDFCHYPLLVVGFCIKILNHISSVIAGLDNAVIYHQSPFLIWIILFYIGLYIIALNKKQSIIIGIILILCSNIGHIVSPRHDYLTLDTEKTIFYIDTNNRLIQLVHYDRRYINPYIKQQIFQYFGRNPNSVYYYEKCNYRKIYVSLSNIRFKC